MPKQLTKRGHRLVFSNGIIFLAGTAMVLIVATGANVDRLIPLYAIGVFASFTLSQSGMAKHHLTKKEKGWRKGIFVNGFGAFLSFVVLIIFIRFKFMEGAWVIILLVPIMVTLLTRLNKQYEAEEHQLADDAHDAVSAPILSRHVVLVFVARLDQSTARAIQYARTLMPDEMRAVHIACGPAGRGGPRRQLAHARPLARPPRARRLPRSSSGPRRTRCRGARRSADAKTEVTVLLPHRLYKRFWHRLLHDHTGDEIAGAITKLEHANVTMVPFQMGEPVPTPVS